VSYEYRTTVIEADRTPASETAQWLNCQGKDGFKLSATVPQPHGYCLLIVERERAN
jgi:hypothetical protein